MPVERRGHDPGFAGDLSQAQAAEAAVAKQLERGRDDGATRRLLAFFPGGTFPPRPGRTGAAADQAYGCSPCET
ncbi:hypothetical protein I553_8422 [Mycobacterium xenopi 4042]|uniref:Uncharacterized protein n=1 Tax=Mycobacterium xenopi 4042 TaxID=1299334 RepID=X8EWM6_MYCXE|nr:hypothetical protein I553_8422 [Mycobacterium xenopi 4042]